MQSNGKKKLLVIQVAALGYDLLEEAGLLSLAGLDMRPAESVFPAVTSTVQATMRTASLPTEHGVSANGFLSRDLHRVLFWEQSAALVHGARIWDGYRAGGGSVGMLFWQQSLGECVDVLLSPAPIHKHHGGMIEDCYAQPEGLYADMSAAVGKRFCLKHYWGPMASVRSSEWIASASAALLRDDRLAPSVCFSYLPGLDYDLQRYGPQSAQARTALAEVAAHLSTLCGVARECGYDVLVYGDYAIGTCERPVSLNRHLREAGLMYARRVGGRLYADLHRSTAFAVADHEVAQVYVRDRGQRDAVRAVLEGVDGVERVLDASGERSGELVAVAAAGSWFDYPWWDHRSEAPDYASHVDIHNKPGYDPCELFWGWPPGSISQNSMRIRGSHGRVGPDRRVAWGGTVDLGHASSLVELASGLRLWMNGDI